MKHSQQSQKDRFFAVNLLVSRARAGDRTAMEELFRRFRAASFAFCRKILRDSERAEDALQESFLEAMRKLPGLRSEAAFAVWFRRILIKQCDRQMRKTREWTGIEIARTGQAPDESVQAGEIARRVREAIAALPEPERQLCVEYYLEDRKQAEISRRTGLPLHAIKNHLFRARRILRVELDSFRGLRPLALAA